MFIDWLPEVLRSWRPVTKPNSGKKRAQRDKARQFMVAEHLEDRTLLSFTWDPAGPAPTLNGQVEGMTNQKNPVSGSTQVVIADPTNPDVLYIGATNGGVWKTVNARNNSPTWTPLTDTQSSMSIGAMDLDPTDITNQTLVAGFGRDSSYGLDGGPRDGIIRTTDGGATWTAQGAGSPISGGNVSAVAARGQVILVGTDDADTPNNSTIGLFRSTNGGTSFQQVGAAGGLPAGAIRDLVGSPTNPNTFYLSLTNAGLSSGVYKSTDTGTTWALVSVAAMNTQIQTSTKVELAAGRANNVYAAIMAPNGTLGGLFRSGDAGVTWTALDLPQTVDGGVTNGTNPIDTSGLPAGPGGRGYLHFSIAADPVNPNIVYVGGERQPDTGAGLFPNSIGATTSSGRIFRVDASRAAGTQAISETNNPTTTRNSSPHSGSRSMAFDAAGNLIETDDGGIYKRSNPRVTGDWSSLNGNLQIAEIHSIAYDSVGNVLTAGTQDTGNIQQGAADASIWGTIDVGDGGVVAIDDTSFAAQGESIRYDSLAGLRNFQRHTVDSNNNVINTVPVQLRVGNSSLFNVDRSIPFYPQYVLNTVDPLRGVIGTQSLYESTDQFDDLVDISGPTGNDILAMAYGGKYQGVANPDVLYYASYNSIYLRAQAGDTPVQLFSYPGGAVQDIVLDPNDWHHAFVVDLTDVYSTSDAGQTWQKITGNINQLVTGQLRTIAYVDLANTTADALVIGGTGGVVANSLSSPTVWSTFGVGMPDAIVIDLEYDPTDDVLAVGTLGRGAYIMHDASYTFNPPSTTGSVNFDQSVYQIGDNVKITVRDLDLVNTGILTVNVVADSGDQESVQLTEIPGTGVFRGQLATSTSDNGFLLRDGNLEVDRGTTITVTYQDASNSFGLPQTDTDTAQVFQTSGLYDFTFTDPNGQPTTDGFTNSGASSQWHLSVGHGLDSGHSQRDSFYFGSRESLTSTGSYANNASGTITSPRMSLVGGAGPVFLEWNQLLEAEDQFDTATVTVITSTGSTVVASNNGISNMPDSTLGAWVHQIIDLSGFVGQQIQVSFTFTSNATNTREGWYVDDVQLSGPAAEVKGTKFLDSNGDGIRQVGEQGLPGWTVFADGNGDGIVDDSIKVTDSTNAIVAIADKGTTSSTISVGGVNGALADVNVRVNIQHPNDGDLVLTLISPLGTRVPLVTNLGGNGANFTGTTFDDQAVTGIQLGVAPYNGEFKPQSSLSVLNGELSNGNWTLEVKDTATGNVGQLVNWSLITTNVGEAAKTTDSSKAIVKIDDRTTSIIPVSGVNGLLDDVNVHVTILHARDADLVMTLVSPSGTRIRLVNGVGGNGANFSGTTFDDQASTGIQFGVAPYAGEFKPQSPLSALNGEPANGNWTLEIVDTATGSNTGTLINWSITTSVMDPSTITDVNGNYTLGGLRAGTYTIGEVMQTGWQQTSPNINLTATGTIQPNTGNAVVGTLSAVDTVSGNTFTYSLAASDSSNDNGSFSITGDTLSLTPVVDFTTKSNYLITVLATDQTGKSFQRQYKIHADGTAALVSFTATGVVGDAQASPFTYSVTLGTGQLVTGYDFGNLFVFPIVNIPSGDLTYTENDPPVVIDARATVTDINTDAHNPQLPAFANGSMLVSLTQNATSDDMLIIRNQGTNPGQIGVSGNDITYGGVFLGTFTGGDGFNPLSIKFSMPGVNITSVTIGTATTFTFAFDKFDTSAIGFNANSITVTNGIKGAFTTVDAHTFKLVVNPDPASPGTPSVSLNLPAQPPVQATQAAVQALVRNIQFYVVGDDPSPLTRTAEFILTDNTNGTSKPVTKLIHVIPVNDAPIVTLSPDPLKFTENDPATPVDITAKVEDFDSPNFDGGYLKVELTGNASGPITSTRHVFNSVDTPYTLNNNTIVSRISTLGLNGILNDVNLTVNITHSNDSDLIAYLISPSGTRIRLFSNIGTNIFQFPVAQNFSNTTFDDSATIPIESIFAQPPYSPPNFTGSFSPEKELSVVNGEDPNGFWSLEIQDLQTNLFSDGTGTLDSWSIDLGTTEISTNENLKILNQGSGSGEIGLVGNRVTYSGEVIGTYGGGVGTTPLLVNLNAKATPEAVTSLMQNVAVQIQGDNPLNGQRQAIFTVNDGDGGTSVPRIKTINVVPVNDNPVLTLPSGQSTYIEGSSPTVLDVFATITDVDSPDFNGGLLTVSLGTTAGPTDKLAIRATGQNPGQISVSGNSVRYGTTSTTNPVVTIGTFSGGIGSTPLTVSFNANATQPAVQALLRLITFQATGANPLVTPRIVKFQLTDGDGGASPIVSKTITVSQTNDPPVLTLSTILIPGPSGDPSDTIEVPRDVVYNASGLPVPIDNLLTITDPDTQVFNGGNLTVTLVSGSSTRDRMGLASQGSVNLSGSNISFAGVVVGKLTPGVGSAPLSIDFNSSASIEAVQAIARSVTFQIIGPSPTGGNRIAEFVVSDGAGGTSQPGDRTIIVQTSNQPPVNTVPTVDYKTLEDVAVSLTGLGVADPDASLQPIRVTLAVTHGTVTVLTNVPGGLSAAQITGNGTNQVVLNGDQESINATLLAANGVKYKPALDYNGQTSATSPLVTIGADVLTMTTNDLGNSGPGGALSDIDSVFIDIQAVHDNAKITPTLTTADNVRGKEALLDTGITAQLGDGQTSMKDSILTVNVTANRNRSDRLRLLNEGKNAGQINVVAGKSGQPASLKIGTLKIGTVTGGENGVPLKIVFNASATAADLQHVLRAITFRTAVGTTVYGTRTVTYNYTDALGVNAAPATKMVNVRQ